MLQGLLLPLIGTGGACGLGGYSSSRCRQLCASGGCCNDSEAPLGIGGAKALVITYVLSVGVGPRLPWSVVADALGGGWGCGKTSPRSPWVQWVGTGHGMCLGHLVLTSSCCGGSKALVVAIAVGEVVGL